jgi:hypothetical protein
LYPTTADALGLQDKFAVCCAGAAPVPVTVSVAEELEAANEIVAEAAPLVWGANFNVNGTLCPAGMLNGKDTPLRTNSELVEVAEDTVTLEPLALNVPVLLRLDPTTTLPKLTDPGETDSWPALVPVADNATLTFGLEALDARFSVPLAAPADFGANEMESVRLCPAVRVCGSVMVIRLNPVPLTDAWEIVTLEPPALVTVSFSILLPGIWMLPKLILEGLAPSKPGVAGGRGGVVTGALVPQPARVIVEVLERRHLPLTKWPDTTNILPLALPADSGVKVAAKSTLFPGAMVTGKLGPL